MVSEITDIVGNFRKFLVKVEPNLREANVAVGEENWDDFSEFNFKLLVIDPAFEKLGLDIPNVYGQWSPPKKNEIKVSVLAQTPILIWPVKSTDGKPTRYEEKTLDEELVFYFREFRHPFIGAQGSYLQHMGQVAGEITKDNVSYHIAAPFESCRFIAEN